MLHDFKHINPSADGALVVPLRSDEDVVRLRKFVRDALVNAGFTLIEQTKMITAASELARNTVIYGGGGDARIANVTEGIRKGVRLSFVDEGPGIPDVKLALTDGYTSGNGMGLGLSGAKRLADEFDLQTEVGKGTTVTITKWKLS